jgi:hypothetical protein
MFNDKYQFKLDLLKALKLFGIPYSEHLWSPGRRLEPDSYDEDDIDKRINQFSTEQHILQAYRNYVDALKDRDKGLGHSGGSCIECLSAAIRSRDTLLDAAKRIQFVRQNNRYYHNQATP